jgi:hypothetical protein
MKRGKPVTKPPEEFKELVNLARKKGWTVVHAGKHLQWRPPDKSKTIVYSAMSPGHYNRSIENTMSKLKASGLFSDKEPQ